MCHRTFPSLSLLNLHVSRLHLSAVRNKLAENPKEIYLEVFGRDYKWMTEAEIRYPGGLIVTLAGPHRGLWYSFTLGKGGGPIKAIQHAKDMSYAEAVAYGAEISGLEREDASWNSSPHLAKDMECRQVEAAIKNKVNRWKTASNLWRRTVPLKGTLAEEYLVRTRGIEENAIDVLAMRFLPKGAVFQVHNREGETTTRENKHPALVVAARNPAGHLTGVQCTFLDGRTANKVTEGRARLSRGVIQGSAGVVCAGRPGRTVYVAEGVETAASVACAAREDGATVLASLSVANFAHLMEPIMAWTPSNVVIAGDCDEEGSAARATLEAAHAKMKRLLTEEHGVPVALAVPDRTSMAANRDWNDVLKEEGLGSMASQMLSKVLM